MTIAAAITISLFNSLTLTPALSALLLGHEEATPRGILGIADRIIRASRSAYHRALIPAMRARAVVLLLVALGLTATAFLSRTTPTAFLPDEDVGYFIATVQAPEGSSLGYTSKVIKAKSRKIFRDQPEVEDIFHGVVVGGLVLLRAPRPATVGSCSSS